MRTTCAVFLLVCASCGSEAATRTAAEPEPAGDREASGPDEPDPPPASEAPHPLPASITADVHLPGADPNRFASATVSLGGLPWTIEGCVSSARGACAATQRVELDEAARTELVRALEEVRAIPRCEPEGIFPGDRTYRLEITGAPRVYEGRLPASESDLAQRNAGPCRADARLAMWIADRLRGSATARAREIELRLTTSRPADRRFLSVRTSVAEARMSGCTSAVAGSCRRTTEVSLAGADEELTRMLDALAANPACPRPSEGGMLTLELATVYDGRCGEMATLGWWIAERFEPNAMRSR
jgi:hypothetical protein